MLIKCQPLDFKVMRIKECFLKKEKQKKKENQGGGYFADLYQLSICRTHAV